MIITILITLVSIGLKAPETYRKIKLEPKNEAILERVYYEDRTEGILYIYKNFECFVFETLEPVYQDNEKGTAIPEGDYMVYLMHPNWKYRYWNYLLVGTGKRTGIRIHIGIKPEHSTGCILMNRDDIRELNKLRLGSFTLKIKSKNLTKDFDYV